MSTSLLQLIPGQPYAFDVNPARDSAAWLAAAGQGACLHRTFLGYCTCDGIACLEVARATGKTHGIALDCVAHVRPVALPD
ncbi:MAG: hypothetical protein ACI802_002798 [Candidatus Paceibacteria bacterium]|jgi:hypothetical protein